MDSTVYQTLKTKVFELKKQNEPDIPICKVTSWAIWNEEKFGKYASSDPYYQGLLQKIETQVDDLNPKIVFVGFNWGGDFKVKDNKGWKDVPDWANFHTTFGGGKDSGDLRIKKVLTDEGNGTRYEGSYMTDLFKNMATPTANDLQAKIKAGEITQEDIDEQIDLYIQEILLLGTDQIEMYLFGADVEGYFIAYKEKLYSALKEKVKLCQRIEHFGPANTRFPTRAPVQLGLEPNNVGAKIYVPVWEAPPLLIRKQKPIN